MRGCPIKNRPTPNDALQELTTLRVPSSQERGAVAAVEVSARKVNVALGSANNLTIGAGHTCSEILGDCTSPIAETELAGADADNSSVVGAGSTIAAAAAVGDVG